MLLCLAVALLGCLESFAVPVWLYAARTGGGGGVWSFLVLRPMHVDAPPSRAAVGLVTYALPYVLAEKDCRYGRVKALRDDETTVPRFGVNMSFYATSPVCSDVQ